jgi:thioredoxin 1
MKMSRHAGGAKMKKVAVLMSLILLFLTFVAINGQKVEKKDDSSTKTNNNSNQKIKVTFIELGSVRCIPCKKMIPIMKEIEKEYGHQVKVVFHDVWTEAGKPYATKHGIKLIPTQIFLDEKGKEYFRHVGFFPKDKLVEVLKQKGVAAVKNKSKKEQGSKK